MSPSAGWVAIASLAIAAGSLASCSGDDPVSDTQAFCDTLQTESAELRNRYEAEIEAAVGDGDLLTGALSLIAALGDVKPLLTRLAEVAPQEIRVDAERIAEQYVEPADISGDPLTAVMTGIFQGAALQGSVERVDDFAARECGQPLFGKLGFEAAPAEGPAEAAPATPENPDRYLEGHSGAVMLRCDGQRFDVLVFEPESAETTVVLDDAEVLQGFTNKYGEDIELCRGTPTRNRPIFDRDYARIAVGWHDDSDDSDRVGWVHIATGEVVDISEQLTSTSDFGSAPHHRDPRFASDGFYYEDFGNPDHPLAGVKGGVQTFVAVDLKSGTVTGDPLPLGPRGTQVLDAFNHYVHPDSGLHMPYEALPSPNGELMLTPVGSGRAITAGLTRATIEEDSFDWHFDAELISGGCPYSSMWLDNSRLLGWDFGVTTVDISEQRASCQAALPPTDRENSLIVASPDGATGYFRSSQGEAQAWFKVDLTGTLPAEPIKLRDLNQKELQTGFEFGWVGSDWCPDAYLCPIVPQSGPVRHATS